MNLYKIFEDGFKDVKKNSPLILTGLACFGVAATSVVSIFAGKKLAKKEEIVKEKIEEKKAKGEVVTKKDSIVLYVREYFPPLAPVIVGVGLTSACAIFSYKESAKRLLAATTIATLATSERDMYKKLAEKLMGEKELEREKLKKQIEENPMPKQIEDKVKKEGANNVDQVYNTTQSWYEPTTNQYIACTESELVKAFEEISSRVKFGESFVSFDEFLWALPVQVKHPKIAEIFGWPYERCKRGIVYDLSDGVKAENGLFVGKIGYQAYVETIEFPIDTIHN